jgi:malonate transporter and related proteins
VLDILSITTPIYLAILVGYLATRLGLFSKVDMRTFGKFVINLALPPLLFSSLSQRSVSDILNVSYLLAYLTGSLLVAGLGYLWFRRGAGIDSTTSSVYAMGIASSNSSFVGYPILLLTVPSIAGVALALTTIVENVVVIPLLLALAEANRGEGRWYRVLGQSLARLARNPMILGLACGVAASSLAWTPPEPVARTIKLFALTSGALSLFVIGGTLVGLSLQGIWQRVALVGLSKLTLHPLAVMAAILVIPYLGLPVLDPSMQEAAVLMAAMPVMGIYPILSQKYGFESFSSAALLVTTIASFFSISTLLWVIRYSQLWS